MHTRRDVLYGLGATGVSLLAARTGFAQTQARSAIDFAPPANATDCHVHIFDPARFPYSPKRVYSPPPAVVDDLLDLHKTLRMERVVIVQPSIYAADNGCTLDAVRKLGARARGVAVIDKDTSKTELEEMDAAGIRGIRINLNTTPTGEIDAENSKRTLDMAVEKIRAYGWHIQFYTRPHVIASLKPHIEQLPFPVVFDHFGGPKAAEGPSQPGYEALLDLVKTGRAYVKISGAYRISEKGPDFADAAPLAQALVAANPERVIWGSDWPHPGSAPRPLTELAPPIPVDDGLLLNQVPKWIPDAATREKIFVANPARLYGFGETADVVTSSGRGATPR